MSLLCGGPLSLSLAKARSKVSLGYVVWTLAVTLCKRSAEAGTENQQNAERNERTCLPRALKVRDAHDARAAPARVRSEYGRCEKRKNKKNRKK